MQIGVDSQRAVENRRIFVLDRNEINSLGLQFILADENETHVMPDLEAACARAVAWPPDLVLLGLDFIAQDAAGVIARILSAMSRPKILLVCAHSDEPGVREALAAGAHGTLKAPPTIEGARRRVDVALGRAAPLGIPVIPV